MSCCGFYSLTGIYQGFSRTWPQRPCGSESRWSRCDCKLHFSWSYFTLIYFNLMLSCKIVNVYNTWINSFRWPNTRQSAWCQSTLAWLSPFEAPIGTPSLSLGDARILPEGKYNATCLSQSRTSGRPKQLTLRSINKAIVCGNCSIPKWMSMEQSRRAWWRFCDRRTQTNETS